MDSQSKNKTSKNQDVSTTYKEADTRSYKYKYFLNKLVYELYYGLNGKPFCGSYNRVKEELPTFYSKSISVQRIQKIIKDWKNNMVIPAEL
jgi:hypothetical protein